MTHNEFNESVLKEDENLENTCVIFREISDLPSEKCEWSDDNMNLLSSLKERVIKKYEFNLNKLKKINVAFLLLLNNLS